MKDLLFEKTMSRNRDHQIDIATGGKHRGRVRNRTVSLARFRGKLSDPMIDKAVIDTNSPDYMEAESGVGVIYFCDDADGASTHYARVHELGPWCGFGQVSPSECTWLVPLWEVFERVSAYEP